MKGPGKKMPKLSSKKLQTRKGLSRPIDFERSGYGQKLDPKRAGFQGKYIPKKDAKRIR